MDIDYRAKYLKYKTKYLDLKEQLGGDDIVNCNKVKSHFKCFFAPGCTWKKNSDGKGSCQHKSCEGRIWEDCTLTAGCTTFLDEAGYLRCKRKEYT